MINRTLIFSTILYMQVKKVLIFDIHSNLQKYQTGNENFVNAVNERINNKGD